jgi:hypothetical protein
MVILCQYCNKEYSSYSSRSNHVKKYHPPNTTVNTPKTTISPTKTHQNCVNELQCEYCKKIFSRMDSKIRHLKNRCKKIININDIKIDDMSELRKQNDDMKKQLDELKDLIQKSLKIHPKTLQKINNQLNNNGIINNNIVIQVGNEDFNKVLSEKEKLYLLNKYANSVVEMVKMVHISDDEKFKPYKSMYITNLQNNVAYKYNEESKKFIAVTKSELLESIIDNRLADIENFHEDYKEKITAFTSKQITKFIERMLDEKEYKDVKKEEIKFAIYNGREEIIQQIKENNPDLNIFT